jgi:hypothetical protein
VQGAGGACIENVGVIEHQEPRSGNQYLQF